jgi:RNA polymerase sigma factor (sigma-70 family)
VSDLASEAIGQSAEVPSGGLLEEFEQLYRSQFRSVTAYFARRSGDPQTVADLTADTFVEAMRSFATFDPARGDVRPWLFSLARHVYAEHAERNARRRDAAERYAARRVLDPHETEELEHRIDAARAGRDLLSRLAELSPLDREAVELVDLAELTPTQAAKTLGIAPGLMRVRLFRARARLRKESNTDV